MASLIKIKRSNVAGKRPTINDLSSGELALNTKDKRAYSADGNSVFEIGANVHSLSVGSGAFSIANGAITFPSADGTQGQFLKTDGNGTLSFGSSSSSYTVTVYSGNTSSAGVVQSLGSLSPDDAIAANPIGHLTIHVNGTDYKIPYMAAVANNSPSISSGDMTVYSGNTAAISQTLGSTAPEDPVVASPDGHIVINISGTDYKLPFFI